MSGCGELLSTSFYRGRRGGWWLKFQPTKQAPTKQGKHVPTKHEENMFPCPWCSHMGPHLLPTLSTICGVCPPPCPPNILSGHKGLPTKGGAPKTAQKQPPRSVGSCPLSLRKYVFPRVISEKNPEGPRTFPAPSKILWTCSETFLV